MRIYFPDQNQSKPVFSKHFLNDFYAFTCGFRAPGEASSPPESSSSMKILHCPFLLRTKIFSCLDPDPDPVRTRAWNTGSYIILLLVRPYRCLKTLYKSSWILKVSRKNNAYGTVSVRYGTCW